VKGRLLLFVTAYICIFKTGMQKM